MARLLKPLLGVLIVLCASGCFMRPRNLPVSPVPLTTLSSDSITPTALPLLQTATQPATPPGGVAITPGGATPTGGVAPAQTAVNSAVKAVMVKDDVRLRLEPGPDGDVLGLVHAGMTLTVTGKSSDEAWWQVECDQAANRVCWISADPELTEPVP